MAQTSLTPVTLPADPTAALQAATKQYTDTKLALTPVTTVKTANYPAVAGDYVSFDLTTGSFTVTMPSAPANGTLIGARIAILGTAGNGVGFTAGGTDVFYRPGGPASVFSALTQGNQSMLWEYQGGIWWQIASGFALANMNLAWQQMATVTTKGDLYVATGSAATARQGVGANGTALVADSTQTNGIAWSPAPRVFASAAARDTAITAPTAGMMCVTTDTNYVWQYYSSAWHVVLPPILAEATLTINGGTWSTTEAVMPGTSITFASTLTMPYRIRYWYSLNIGLSAAGTVDTHLRYNTTGSVAAVTDTLHRQTRATYSGQQTIVGNGTFDRATGGTTVLSLWSLTSGPTATTVTDATLGQFNAYAVPI